MHKVVIIIIIIIIIIVVVVVMYANYYLLLFSYPYDLLKEVECFFYLRNYF